MEALVVVIAAADGLGLSLGMVVGLVFVARMGVGKVMELGKVAAGRPDAWTGGLELGPGLEYWWV